MSKNLYIVYNEEFYDDDQNYKSKILLEDNDCKHNKIKVFDKKTNAKKYVGTFTDKKQKIFVKPGSVSEPNLLCSYSDNYNKFDDSDIVDDFK
jgi:hypothetical protein